jgi:hypothetical protein
MNSKPKRRWYQFSLRTMFVLVFVVSAPLAWVGCSLSWIRQRHEALDARQVYDSSGSAATTAPGGLWLFGDRGVITIFCSAENAELARRLFPEALISSLSPSPRPLE